MYRRLCAEKTIVCKAHVSNCRYVKTFELVANSERRYETASLDDAGIASPAIGSTFPYLHNVIMFLCAGFGGSWRILDSRDSQEQEFIGMFFLENSCSRSEFFVNQRSQSM